MALYNFGSGLLWGIPTADAFGNPIAANVATPVNFGVLQEVSVDINFETKMLYGQNQFPVAVGRGKGSVKGKAKFAQLYGQIINSLFFGQTLSPNLIASHFDTVGSIVPATPFIITPSIPGGGTWLDDLGVRDSNSVPLTRVASSPAAGQYSVTNGSYTFNSAQNGQRMFISYRYTQTNATARQSVVNNVIMGNAPTFRCELSEPFQGRHLTISMPNCVSNKLALSTRLDDFQVPEFEWDAFADAAGNVLTYSLSE